MVTTTVTREQIARPVIDLVEKFGFQCEVVDEYSLPDLAQRIQIRNEANYAPGVMVGKIRAAMERGDRLPPIVVTRDGHLVDGNTRVTAAQQNRIPHLHAVILDVDFEGATEDETHRLWTLGAAFNARHGKGINREELRRAVAQIGADPTYSASRIAGLIGVTDRVVLGLLAEKKGRDRAESLGLHPNGSFNAPRLGMMGRLSENLNDQPFTSLFSLIEDTGMSIGEIKDVAQRAHDTKSDQGALEVLDKEREARKDQIAIYKASGKSVPPTSAKLRQRLGFILNFEGKTKELIEHNPTLTEEHVALIDRSIAVLQALKDTQEG